MKGIFRNFIVLVLLGCNYSFGQNFSTLWDSHYSYNNVVDIVTAGDYFYAAAENAVFKYDPQTQEMQTITTVEGLSGGAITTILYSETFQSLLIGYETGLMELYSETDNSILSIVDIVEKDNITPVNKIINHFYENNGLVYISTDFGISVYDLDRLEFGDTYFIGNGGTQISVQQTTVLNNEIYAACQDSNGLKRADLSSPNLIDSAEWQTIFGGNILFVDTFNDKIYFVRNNRRLMERDNGLNTTILTFPQRPIDSSINDGLLIYTFPDTVLQFDTNISLSNTLLTNSDFDTVFSSSIFLNGISYVGSEEFGVLSTELSNIDYVEIKPNGPLFNDTFKVNARTNSVWLTFGDYSQTLNPNPVKRRGISYFRNELWNNIRYDSILESKNLTEVAVNPFIENQVFVASFRNGILELNNFEPTIRYDATNSGLTGLATMSIPPNNSVRVSAVLFDNDGLLWSTTSRAESPLKSYDPLSGTWQTFDFSSIIPDALESEFGFYDITIDPNGTKWLAGYSNGLYAFNESIANNPLRNIVSEEQNLPTPAVRCVAIDNTNQLWIGTFNGLRVLFNTSGFYNDPNPTLNSIIILEDGIAQELLAGQVISDIEVDGSNNKWVATTDSGAFYFSPDGQNTIYHFTTDNSPLPSNSVLDISVSPQDGTVYFATVRGMVSFKVGGSEAGEDLEDAFAYPNPVRPEYNILGFNDLNDITKGVKISGLTERVNIKITDIEGNLVAEAQSGVNFRTSSANYNFAIDGGTAIWNGKNLANSVVRSGVYLIMISDLDSFETKVIKLLIIR